MTLNQHKLRTAPSVLGNATKMPATQQFHGFLCALVVYFVLSVCISLDILLLLRHDYVGLD